MTRSEFFRAITVAHPAGLDYTSAATLRGTINGMDLDFSRSPTASHLYSSSVKHIFDRIAEHGVGRTAPQNERAQQLSEGGAAIAPHFKIDAPLGGRSIKARLDSVGACVFYLPRCFPLFYQQHYPTIYSNSDAGDLHSDPTVQDAMRVEPCLYFYAERCGVTSATYIGHQRRPTDKGNRAALQNITSPVLAYEG